MIGTVKLQTISTDACAERMAVITILRVWLTRFSAGFSIFFVCFIRKQHLSFVGLSIEVSKRKALRLRLKSQGVTYAGVGLPETIRNSGSAACTYLLSSGLLRWLFFERKHTTHLPSVSVSHRISFRARTNTFYLATKHILPPVRIFTSP